MKNTDPEEKEINSAISAKIREMRIATGITQAEFADLLGGVSQAYVNRIERADYSFSISVLRRICKALDTTLTDFFDDLGL